MNIMEDVRNQQQDNMDKLDIMGMLRMAKTLTSLGQSIEADEMCDEVFKNYNSPNIDTSIEVNSKTNIDTDTGIIE